MQYDNALPLSRKLFTKDIQVISQHADQQIR